MVDIRILADDLTGALDSAVAFAGGGRLGVTWHYDQPPGPRAAVDLATREGSRAVAARRHLALASWLAKGALSFKKLDSLLRGHVTAEIAACIRGGSYDRVIIAPAFPFQGRVTRGGRQLQQGEGHRGAEEAAVGPDIAADLAQDFRCAIARPGEIKPSLITIYDAETDTDLDRIVDAEMARPASRLWVGSGGLAAALARHCGVSSPPISRLAGPFLGLIGTDHLVTAAQVAAFADRFRDGHVVLGDDLPAARHRLAERMQRSVPSLASIQATGSRDIIARRIDAVFGALLQDLPVPGLLLVTGGETLRSVCNGLGAHLLAVESEFEPGLPISRICGGSLDGVTAVTKSGGFGTADLFLRLCGRLER